MSDLRPVEPRHATSLAEIFRAGFASFVDFAPEGWAPPDGLEGPAEFERAIERPDVWGRVVGDEPRLAGYVMICPATVKRGSDELVPGLGHLWMLFIRREHWGEGHGRRLLAAAVEELRARGFEEARLVTPAGNRRSCELYERGGWRAVETKDEPFIGLPITEYRLKL
jgi:ribosomal protein S18 acetylase RimI-like enzyme